jgi:hypothetical protein
MAVLFINFENYRFDITLETAQAIALFFAFLGFTQFVYTLLTPRNHPKENKERLNKSYIAVNYRLKPFFVGINVYFLFKFAL